VVWKTEQIPLLDFQNFDYKRYFIDIDIVSITSSLNTTCLTTRHAPPSSTFNKTIIVTFFVLIGIGAHKNSVGTNSAQVH